VAKQKKVKYTSLRDSGFTPLEARELSVLPKSTPALKAMIEDRIAKRARFEKLAATKVAHGKWRRSQVGAKWLKSLSRMYSRNNWRVQHGPTGKQQSMPKHGINPWASYRAYEKQQGGTKSKNYVSPWQIHQLASGKTRLEKGLVFVRQVERKAKRDGSVSQSQVRSWIAQKEQAINESSGKRKAQLIIEKNRLERLL
jgi:hypothetical protein